MPHKLFIITGEPSGDLHGSNLVRELLRLSPDMDIQCWGGDRMAAAGARVMKHIDELAFMGFVEVAMNIDKILRNFRLCREQIAAFQPDAVVLMDYPGFNLRMAKHIHAMGIPVVYYISPQIWAWKESRVNKIKACVDHVFVILPFEQAFYRKHGVDAAFVGHPLLDEVRQINVDKQAFLAAHGIPADKPIVALLPGSRKQEIERILPEVSRIIDKFPGYRFVVSKVHWQPMEMYTKAIGKAGVHMLEGSTYSLLKIAEAAIVTSGTATLETALIGTPQVVVYKANWLSVHIARWLVKVSYISLVNLIMDQEVVKELIQDDVSAKNLETELQAILPGGSRRDHVLHQYTSLRQRLGAEGASAIVANKLLKILEKE